MLFFPLSARLNRMPSGHTIRIPKGFATIVTQAQLQDRPEWQEAFQDKCKDHRFYELIGTTLTENVRLLLSLFSRTRNGGCGRSSRSFSSARI